MTDIEDLVDAARAWKEARELWKTTNPTVVGPDVAIQRELDAVAAERVLKDTIEDLQWHR